MRALAVLAVLAACADPPGSVPVIVSASPDYGPLVGGTRITVTGSHFDSTTRVLIGGREAPLAHALDSETLDVIIPPGDQPGDAELVVLAVHGTAIAEHAFHYSSPPALDTVSPSNVLARSTTTQVTLTGLGFVDDAAGEAVILVDGVLATDVTITSDTELTFTAPAGPALVRPTIQLVNQRGSAEKSRAFRYAISDRPGLLMFPRFGTTFATFFDPITGDTASIQRFPATNLAFTTVFADESGELWAFDRNRRFGRIDFRTQTLIDPVQSQQLFPALVRAGSLVVGIERISRTFGSVDPFTSTYTRIGTATLPCCGSFGIATDGTTLWFTSRAAGIVTLSTIDLATGALGTALPLVDGGTLHFEELRYFAGTLYATGSDETLRAIDRTTGATTVLPFAPGRVNAMELVE